MTAIRFEGVWKVFGPGPEHALRLYNEGLSKDDIRTKTGNTLALCNVSLEIKSGETYVVMGLSGSGKSTLVRLVNRLISAEAGDVIVSSSSVMAMNKAELQHLRRHDISMVFQHFALFPHMKVMDNVAYGLHISGTDKDEARERANDWIGRVGLSGYAESYPAELSGGMQQRVGLARAMAVGPKILLMDEPFSALDPLIRLEMQNELQQLRGELDVTILFITHDMNEAVHLGNHIALLRDGEVVQQGTPHSLMEKPADDYTRAFLNTLR